MEEETKNNKSEDKETRVEVEIVDSSDSEKDSKSVGKKKDKKKKKKDKLSKAVEEIKTEYDEKLQDLEDRNLRLAAEFDNYKKRTARQFEDMKSNARKDVFYQILEVVDNYERALNASENSQDFQALQKGTELIYQQFKAILAKSEIQPIDAVGQQFNPELHEAMMQIESNEFPEGIVAQEIVKGYMIGSRVLRFVKVAVSSGPKSDAVDEAEKDKDKDAKENEGTSD